MTETHTAGARDARGSGSARDARGSASARDARGRFQPGTSGNPAGKKPGTLNHATRLKLLLADEQYDVVARHMIDAATEGAWPAVRFLMERLVPKPRGRAIDLDLPAGASRAARLTALVELMCAGEISADEARATIAVLDRVEREAALSGAARRTPGADLHSACKSPETAGPVVDGGGREDGGEGRAHEPADHLHFACISRSAAPASLRQRLLGSTSIPVPVSGPAAITWPAASPLKRAA